MKHEARPRGLRTARPPAVVSPLHSGSDSRPASDANGTINLAAPNDQYPINTTNAVWRYDGCGQGLGKDWSVFAVNPNSNTGPMPHQVYGFPVRMT